MEESLSQLGIGGIFAIIMVKTVLEAWGKWQTTQRERRGVSVAPPSRTPPVDMVKLAARVEKMHEQIDDLYTWHNVVDEDGIRRWVIRADMRETIHSISENVRSNRSAIERQAELIREVNQGVEKARSAIRSEFPRARKISDK